MTIEKTRIAGLLLFGAMSIVTWAPLPGDGAIGPSGGCEHYDGPNGRGDSSSVGGAVGGGGTEGTTGLASDEGCPSSMSTVGGARGPAGPTIDASTTGPDSRPPSGMG